MPIEFFMIAGVVGIAAKFWLMRYRLIYALRSPIVVVDPKMHIIALNAAAEQLLAERQARLIGNSVFDYLLTPENPFTSQPSADFETRFRRANGVIFEASVHITRENRGWLLELHDLTEQRERERTMTISEERFRILAEMTYDYTYSVRLMPDNSFKREWVTESFTRITGYPASSDFDWLNLVHPDDLPALHKARDDLRQGKQIEHEYRIIRQDGEIRWLRDYTLPFWDEKHERIVRFLGVARDITREKDAEHTLRKLAEGVSRDTGIPFMRQIVETLVELLKMDFAYVGRLITPDTVQTIVFYADGQFSDNITYSLKGTPCETIIGKTTDFYLSEVKARFPEDTFLRNNSIESYIATPLFDSNKQPQGLVGLMSRKPLKNPEWATSLLQICAVRVSVELERMDSEAQLRTRNNELEALRSIALLLGSTLDLFEILDIALTHMHNLVPYERAGIALRYDDHLYFVNGRGFSSSFAWDQLEKLINEDPSWRDIHTLTAPRIFADVATEANWQEIQEVDTLRSLLVVPILSREQGRGMLFLMSGPPNIYTENHATLSLAVTRQVATALENAQLYSDMESRVEERTNELQAQHDRTETILRNVADAIMFMDEAGHILYVNTAWEALTGYSVEESMAMNFADLSLSQTDAMWDTLRKRKPWRGLFHITRKDGKRYDAEFTVVPVKQEQRFVSVHRDVTQARQYEEMQRRFISDAAHDLGNPVANLKLHLDLMQRKPENTPRYLNIIRHETERLDALVQDLLMLSRLDRGILPRHIETLDLNQIIQRVVENHTEAAREKNITLLYDPAAGPLLFYGDQRQIERVVVNLISNALDYTPDGGEVLIMSIREENEMVFAVRDTGIGISTKDLPHIFDRFFRTDAAKLMSGKGSGLGLSIVKSIVEGHGGQIQVTSAPGDGTYFHVAFPV